MTATSITLICFGVLVAISRGPLILAPAKTHDVYLRWIGNNNVLRLWGVVMGALSVLVIYTTAQDIGLVAKIVHGFAWFIAVACVVALIPFPGPIGRMGTAIWSRFSDGILRGMGLLSVLVGAWLVWFGLTLSP